MFKIAVIYIIKQIYLIKKTISNLNNTQFINNNMNKVYSYF